MKNYFISSLLFILVSFGQTNDSKICDSIVQEFNTAQNEQNWNKVVDLTSEETFAVIPKETLVSTYSLMSANGTKIITNLKEIHSSSETIKVNSKHLFRMTYLVDFKIFLSGQLLSNIELISEGANEGFGKENVSTTDSSIIIKRLSSYLLINSNNSWKVMPANSEEMEIVSQFFSTADLIKIGLPHEEKLTESNVSEETKSFDNLPWYFQEPSEVEQKEFINRLETKIHTSDEYSGWINKINVCPYPWTICGY